jgi:hypothetical protein
MQDSINLVQYKLGPEAAEIPRWKSQVDFLVKTLTNERNKADWFEIELNKSRKEVSKMTKHLKYIED